MNEDDLIKRLRAEEERLLQKLEGVRFALRAYGVDVAADSAAPIPREQRVLNSLFPVSQDESGDFKRQRSITVRKRHRTSKNVLNAVADFIVSRRNEPQSLRDIFNHVSARGFEIGGQNPPATLSAMLSNSDKFTNSDRNGWILVDPSSVRQEGDND